MKLNYNNTALKLLDKMAPNDFSIISDGSAKDGKPTEEMSRLAFSIIKIWPNVVDGFKSNIRYISDPFYTAYEKSAHKLGSVIDAEPINESGTFVFRASESEVNTIFYKIETKGKAGEWDMDFTAFIFSSHSKKDRPALGIVCQRRYGMPAGAARFYASKPAIDAATTPTSVIVDIYTLILFLRYCEVETKVVQAGKREKHIGVKYINETKSNIKILDSTWFTTLIKSDGFNVRGHFRLQPYGPGNSLRKLIWVDAFEKEGYTRTAKVLTENNK